jgi:hypothetical protein
VSKRHQANRRKSYGRRQHELSERRDREHQPIDVELGFDDIAQAGLSDHMAFAESRTPRLHYALGD